MPQYSHRKRRSSRPSVASQLSIATVLNAILLFFYTVLGAVTTLLMYRHHLLAFRYVNVIYTIVLLLLFFLGLYLVYRKKGRWLTSIFLLLATVAVAISLLAFKSVIDVAKGMNDSTHYSEVEMSVVVPRDSSISDVTDLSSLQAPTGADGSNIESLLSQIKSDKGVDLRVDQVDSYQMAYENLIKGESQAMILNSAYSSLLELSYDDYASNLKTIYSYKIKKKTAEGTPTSTDKVFNLYISGIDTYGSISTVSRSDVNIILTINMTTHKILMTTTPRDAYVQIPDGGADQYDKLTHAGIYGVETSEKTLEKLYNIDIDYYARINFTSFLALIDAIGGVTVSNDQAFTAFGYTFNTGNISLESGQQALAFVRERYSLENGDYDRGQNQLKVIQAIIDKLTSPHSLSNYTTIVSTLQDSIQTNMSLDRMMSLVNAQLDSGQPFTMTSQEVTGTGSTGVLSSYAMPNASLYMIQLDDASVATARQAIKDVMEGK